MPSVSAEAVKLLEAYDWPGNVRQLEHIIDQIIIVNNSPRITTEMLPHEIAAAATRRRGVIDIQTCGGADNHIPSISQMERQLISQTLILTSNSVPSAAKSLGLSEATLYRKIRKYQISRPAGG